jgi:hypothetical protein
VNFPTRIKSALEYISPVCVNRRQIEIGSLLTSPQCVSEDKAFPVQPFLPFSGKLAVTNDVDHALDVFIVYLM